MESHKHNKMNEEFWNAQSSEQEELHLRQCMSKLEDEALRDYLSYTSLASQREELDETFEKKVLSEIKSRGVRSSRLTGWFGIAASLVLVIGMAVAFNFYIPTTQTHENVVMDDTFENPEMAFEEVKKALMILSSGMKEGKEHTEVLGEFHRTKESIESKK